MTFVLLKFLHVAFMFLGTALAIGPAALLFLVARSHDAPAIRRTFHLSNPIFQISTACYGGGIVFGVAAAAAGTLELTAHWLLTAYVLVALLGIHGIAFDRWTKGIVAHGDPVGATARGRLGLPLYLLVAMVALVVLIVYVMVTKAAPF